MKPGEQQPESPKAITPFEEEIVKGIQSRPQAVVRCEYKIVVSADNEARANQLLNDLSGAFVQFSSNEMNSLQLSKISGGALEKFLFNFSFRLLIIPM